MVIGVSNVLEVEIGMGHNRCHLMSSVTTTDIDISASICLGILAIFGYNFEPSDLIAGTTDSGRVTKQ